MVTACRPGERSPVRTHRAAWPAWRLLHERRPCPCPPTSVRRVRWNDGRSTLLTSTERLTLQTCTSYYKTADKLVILAVPVA